MLKIEANFDFAKEFAEKWNQKLKSVRIFSFVLSIFMIVCGVLCVIFPVQAVLAAEILAAVVIITLGVYEIIDYFCEPGFLRQPMSLIGGVLNLIIGILLIFSPSQVTISTFAFLFGILLMVFGVDKITFAHRLNFFTATNYSWVVTSGILNILAAIAFIVVPLASTVVLNYIVAAYLFVGGITLFIEAVSIKSFKVK